MPYVDAAESLNNCHGSDGNGAAKRIAPLGLTFCNATDLREKAENSARVTHTHPVGIDGGAVQAWSVAYVVRLDPSAAFPRADFCKGLVRFAQTNQMHRKLVDVIAALADQLPVREAAAQLGNGNHVAESMPFALHAFLHHLHSFEECLFCATLHGGERE
jgi:poly(ADP-ribose) glycohydrolase ARH3